ncbi:MAG TPA: hypothetical protein VN253_16155 [Kofleriaceae bacterium]|nr:hypothetical protein [Kofleriaceae bacterium]
MKCSGLGLLVLVFVLVLLASCSTTRNANVCCANDTECAKLGLPPGSANEYGCSQGFVCQDFYCVAETAPDAAVDAPIDTPSGRCNPNAPFGVPMPMPNVNTQFEDLSVALTYDQLKAYIGHFTATGHVIVTSRRASVESDFPVPTSDPTLAAVTIGFDYKLYIYPTSDDLVVYYRQDITMFAASRLHPDDPFGSGTAVLVDGMQLQPARAMISADSLTLYWSGPSAPLRAATYGSANVFVNGRVATTFDLTDFAISADELTLYYSNYPNPDIFRTIRLSRNVPFDVGIPLANVNTIEADIPLYISPDDCFLYLRAPSVTSNQRNDFWIARRGY